MLKVTEQRDGKTGILSPGDLAPKALYLSDASPLRTVRRWRQGKQRECTSLVWDRGNRWPKENEFSVGLLLHQPKPQTCF